MATEPSPRMPVLFIPHGGGPWPFVEMGLDPREVSALADYLRTLPTLLPAAPKALLVISAHWEGPRPLLMTSPRPPMLYDYYGFPPASYSIQWPAPGEPALARRVATLLRTAGFDPGEDEERGFDHGTFVPLKVAWPEAEVPTVQLSLLRSLDPADHLRLGRALAPLRDEGVLIIGSGMSFHNLRGWRDARVDPDERFHAWLREVGTREADERDRELIRWEHAPAARQVHPREEHLLPLMVVAGAAEKDIGQIGYADRFMGRTILGLHFGLHSTP